MTKSAKALYRCLLTGGTVKEQLSDSIILVRTLIPLKVLLPLCHDGVYLLWPRPIEGNKDVA